MMRLSRADAHRSGNLLDGSYCDSLPKAAADALGRLDIICKNASVITRGDVVNTSDSDRDMSVGVNINAPFRICHAAVPIIAVAPSSIPRRAGGFVGDRARCIA